MRSTPSGLPGGGRFFYRLRVGVLLAILAGVAAYAALDRARRTARREWQRPLQVALVLLSEGAIDPAALAQLRTRIDPLEVALQTEFARYGGNFRPIRFRVFGPATEPEAPPHAPDEPSLLDAIRLSLALGRFARASDRVLGVNATDFDGRIYARLRAPKSIRQALVEGLGEDGGRIAITNIELSDDSVDFGLFVVAHELFHLLGASDRYGPDGDALLPEGLGEPRLEPLYPQRSVEIMARGRVLAPGQEVPPADLGELRVGERTAREIGWFRSD
jgi:hypothetical protein